MNDITRTILPLRSMKNERPLDLSFLPDHVAEPVSKAMNRMHELAQKCEDGTMLTRAESREYADLGKSVVDTMTGYLQDPDCIVRDPDRRAALVAQGSHLAEGAEMIAKLGRRLHDPDEGQE